MRIFYTDEAYIETLLQIALRPTKAENLVSQPAGTEFYKNRWTEYCHGYYIITPAGQEVIDTLRLKLPPAPAFKITIKTASDINGPQGQMDCSQEIGMDQDIRHFAPDPIFFDNVFRGGDQKK